MSMQEIGRKQEVDDRFTLALSGLKASPQGVEFKATVFNKTEKTVEFGVVDLEERDVSPRVACEPHREVELHVSNLKSLSCALRYREV